MTVDVQDYTKSRLEVLALQYMEEAGLPEPVREYEGIEGRRYRFDFCWPDQGIAMEIHGATYTGKGHTGGKGFESDRRKMNLANLEGWVVFEFTDEHMRKKPYQCVELVAKVVGEKIEEALA